jgi:hypothetical protein
MEPHPYGQALAARDLHGLVALLADDVIFHSPVITEPGFVGRDSVAALLAMVLDRSSLTSTRTSSATSTRASSLATGGCLASRSRSRPYSS